MSPDTPKMHTEVLYPLDAEFGDRHRMQQYREPGYAGPWDGDDTYLLDMRCPKCAFDYALGAAAKLVEPLQPLLAAEIRSLGAE